MLYFMYTLLLYYMYTSIILHVYGVTAINCIMLWRGMNLPVTRPVQPRRSRRAAATTTTTTATITLTIITTTTTTTTTTTVHVIGQNMHQIILRHEMHVLRHIATYCDISRHHIATYCDNRCTKSQIIWSGMLAECSLYPL